jgi:Coenzyme PQQ synthesis protein D (PqqD)
MMSEVKSLNQSVFRLSDQVYIERFIDGALVVYLGENRLIELNPTADEILSLTDGKRTLEEVAVDLAQNHEISITDALEDIKELCMQLHSWKILEEVPIRSNGSEKEK